MDRETVKRIIGANVGAWVRVRPTRGSDQKVFIVNIDEEGYVNKVNDDDELFWTTFDDIEEVFPERDNSGFKL